MDIETIQALLEKYFEGTTTLEEDQVLLGYFSGDSVDRSFEPYRKQFMLIRSAKAPVESGPDFERRLTSLILSMPAEPVKINRRPLIIRLSMAAGIALLMGLAGIMYLGREHPQKDTFEDPQLAYAEAQKTLLYVSQKMNQGMKPLQAVKKINSATKPLNSLNKMDHSLDMLNPISIINRSSNLKK